MKKKQEFYLRFKVNCELHFCVNSNFRKFSRQVNMTLIALVDENKRITFSASI